ncbi:STM2901 family protein [Pantoea sp. FN060301]|uniref:STM2901 family protein n=1 Tax=Pantoea sp. FN060301 TaxID=3420380 RepID=UPI003D162C8D
MDTVEELNGTYFYAGRSNLTASELFFMIFCETTADHFGIKDIAAVVALYSGVNNQETRTKPKGTKEGTSRVSKSMRRAFKTAKFPFGLKMPTWVGGYTPWTAERRMVAKISTFVGRTIPLVGEVILLVDVSQITYCSIRDYNRIARNADKLW